MKCPACKEVVLSMSERNGVEIDYCPQCRGVWLDRGELDKILEKVSESQKQTQAPSPMPTSAPAYTQAPQHHGEQQYYKHKRKKSLLEEFFD